MCRVMSARVMTHMGLNLKEIIQVLMLNIISEIIIVLTLKQKKNKYDFHPKMQSSIS